MKEYEEWKHLRKENDEILKLIETRFTTNERI